METQEYFELKQPPFGRVEAQASGSSAMIRWAPGNGVVYQLIATPVPDEVAKVIGGTLLLSLMRRDGKSYVSYPGNPGGFYHLSFVEEKWGKDLGEEGTLYATALLNWALFGDDVSGQYAKEMFEEAQRRWQ